MSNRQTFANTVFAEWVKFTTVRSTLWVLATTGLLVIGFAALIGAAIAASWDVQPEEVRSTFDATSTSLAGTSFAQIAIAVLGVLMVTSEYSSGLIRNTFAATPRRFRNFLAKAVVFTPVVLITSAVFSIAAFFLGQAIFASQNIAVSIGDPGVLRAVLGSAVYLVSVGLMGIAVGVLLRSTAAGITLMSVSLFVLPILSLVVPQAWREKFFKFLPSNAGTALMSVRSNPELLSPLNGLLVLAAFVVCLFASAAFVVNGRDV